jgi:hypothetical protein
VLSLRGGGKIAEVVGHLINPHNLRVDALWCYRIGSKTPLLLLPVDIREISPRAVAVNDISSLSDPEDVVRLTSMIELHFSLVGKKVISGKIPRGKITDYAVDRDSLVIQKIYVTPPVWGRFSTTQFLVDRSQVTEVTPHYVKIQGGDIKNTSPAVKKHTLRTPQSASSISASADTISE